MSGIQKFNENSTVKKFKENIKQLTDEINQLSEPISLSDSLLTKRQIAKRILIYSTDEPMEEEDAHLIIYGKLLYDKDNKLIEDDNKYPECVDKDNALKEDHTIYRDYVNDVQNKGMESYKKIINMGKDLKTLSTYTTLKSLFTSIEIVVAGIPILGTATIPSTLSSIATLVQNLQQTINSIKDISKYIEDLKYLLYIIKEDSIEKVFNPINTIILSIIGVIKIINGIKEKIDKITDFLGDSKDNMQKLKEKSLKEIEKDNELSDEQKQEEKRKVEENFYTILNDIENLPSYQI